MNEFETRYEVCEFGFVLSHPSRKNKNAARMGHPFFVENEGR
jgi:hypothetical protein